MNSLILICALGLSHAECSVDTAEQVVQGPETESLASCGMVSQAYLAETAMADYLDGQHYLKITCSPGDERRAERQRARWLALNQAPAAQD